PGPVVPPDSKGTSRMTQPAPTRVSLVGEFIDIITNVAVPHHEPPNVVVRRRIVAAIVTVVGTVVLGYAMTRQADEVAFYWLTLASAAVWMVGALASGPLHLGIARFRG